jgi:hypothetical protein
LSLHDLGEIGGTETVTLLESEMFGLADVDGDKNPIRHENRDLRSAPCS